MKSENSSIHVFASNEDKDDPNALVDICITRQDAEILWNISNLLVDWQRSDETVGNFAKDLYYSLREVMPGSAEKFSEKEYFFAPFCPKGVSFRLFLTSSSSSRAQSDTE